MAPGMMTVDDALWRVAELASRCSDPTWRGDRTQAMKDLEAAIHEIGNRQNDCAAFQAQAEAAEADRGDDLRALRRAHHELSVARAALASVEAERDKARSALAAAHTALASARAAQATARAETEEAEARRLAALKARRMAESERDAAVGVLARRPAPTETTEIDVRTPEEAAATTRDKVVDFRREAPSSAPKARAPETQLLHVTATLGHLLPDDLRALLVPGTRVIRREGRLAALLAVPSASSQWTQSPDGRDEKQADILRAQGFRVEWSPGDCLAS